MDDTMGVAGDFGGRNDKFGNDFERHWVIEQALRVLDERVLSLMWEPIGVAGRGIDLTVVTRDGIREFHQCKMKNRAEGRWTAGDLNAEGVLKSIKHSLHSCGVDRFVFVSRDPVPVVEELADRARRCNSDPKAFVESSLTSAKHRQQFETICSAWGLNPANERDQAVIVSILCRVKFEAGIHGDNRREMQERLANLLVEAQGCQCIETLGRLLSEQMGNEVRVGDIRSHLRRQGMPTRNLTNDSRVATGIEHLVDAFNEALGMYLIGGELIPREETNAIINSIFEDKDRIICVHGDAGSGKSGVLFELVQRLTCDGVPVIPIRFDEQRPENGLEQYSKTVLGLPAPPSVCLRQIAGDRSGVLIIDQLDAIRWTGGHSGLAWQVAREMVDQIVAVPNLHVVIACRTFDINDDRRFRDWLESKIGKGPAARPIAVKLVVKPLTETQLKDWLERHLPKDFTLSQHDRHLLRNMHCLFLWWDQFATSGKTPSSVSKTELLRMFWQSRIHRAASERGLSLTDLESCMAILIEYLNREGRLDCPWTIVSQFPQVIDAMRSLHVIHKPSSTVVRFVHQSYLDFQIAERVIRNSHNQAPVEWIRCHDQSLFRRDQLRQVLSLLRDDDPAQYTATLSSLITSNDIRFHLQHLALNVLRSQTALTDSETKLVLDLLAQKDWRTHVLREVIVGSTAWFTQLSKHRVLQQWLQGGYDKIGDAFWVFRSIMDVAPHLIEAELEPYWPGASTNWNNRLAALLSYQESHDTPTLFRWRLHLIDEGYLTSDVNHIEYCYKEPKRESVELLGAFCRATLLRIRNSLDVAEALNNDWRHWQREYVKLRSACRSSADLCWNELLPVLLESLDLLRKLRRDRRARWNQGVFGRASTYDQERWLSKLNGLIYRFLTASIRGTLQAAEWIRNRYRLLSLVHSRGIARLSAELWCAAPSECADEAILWLAQDLRRFELGNRRKRPPEWPARRILRQHVRRCKPTAYTTIEAVVLSYFPRWEVHRAGDDINGRKSGPYLDIERFGRGQLVLLEALSHRRSSPVVKGRLKIWLAKFGRYWIGYRPYTTSGGLITYPIPRDKLYRVPMSDWLAIMRTDWPNKPNANEWKQISPDVASERSHRQFAEAFQLACHINPVRMKDVTRVMPLEPTDYCRAALRAFTEVRPPEKVAGVPEDWAPVPVGIIESFLQRLRESRPDTAGWELCHLLQLRPSEAWSESTIDRIFQLALEFGDEDNDADNQSTEEWKDDGEETMFTFGGVRDSAVYCINSLLFTRPDLALTRMDDIAALINDKTVKVRAMSQLLCLHYFNEHRNDSFDLFMKSCDFGNDLLFASPFTMRCLSYLWRIDVDRISPLLKRMIESEISKVVKRGATIVIYGFITKGCFKDIANAVLVGSAPQRSGAARAIADLTGVPEWQGQCFELFSQFCHDPDPSVSGEVTANLRSNDKLLHSAHGPSFALAFVTSPAFERDSWDLIHSLEQFTGNLHPYAEVIRIAVERFCQFAQFPAARSPDFHMTERDLAPLLLRFYQQTEGVQHRELRNTCLDAWDNLLRTGEGRTQLNMIDLA